MRMQGSLIASPKQKQADERIGSIATYAFHLGSSIALSQPALLARLFPTSGLVSTE